MPRGRLLPRCTITRSRLPRRTVVRSIANHRRCYPQRLAPTVITPRRPVIFLPRLRLLLRLRLTSGPRIAERSRRTRRRLILLPRRGLLLLPPAFLENIAPDDLDAVLAHELAHIQRHDFAKNLLYGLVSLAFRSDEMHTLWRLVRR